MKRGAIKNEEINGAKFDIRKEGASIALESESIFYEMILEGGFPAGEKLTIGKTEAYMKRGMTRRVVQRIKLLFFDCIVGKGKDKEADEEWFENLDPSTITQLFMIVKRYQLGEADIKKKKQNDTQE